MYLKKIQLRNIKSFSNAEISFVSDDNSLYHWTALFGPNGLGKSTLLQAIGIALAGPSATRELIPVADNWVRRGEPYGEIIAEIMWTEGDSRPPIRGAGNPKTKNPYIAKYIVTGPDPEKLPDSVSDKYFYTVPTIVPWSGKGLSTDRAAITNDMRRLQQTAYSEVKEGWLACGYGAFRRLSGGAQEADRILYAERISARFITLFREDAALTNTVDWLLRLYNTSREGDMRSEKTLSQVRYAFANRLFPEPVELVMDAKSVALSIGGNRAIPLRDLSDGYRSMLALATDLLRWLTAAYPSGEIQPLACPGVVLIDELDAHLHPSWQQEIGHWLREKFPRLQFIIATHSPFLAQVSESKGANSIDSSVLARTGGNNIVLEQTAGGVVANPYAESVENLRADQILQSPLFDLGSLYSPKTLQRLERLEQLESRLRSGETLSPEESREFAQLELWQGDIPSTVTPGERRLEMALRDLIQDAKDDIAEVQ